MKSILVTLDGTPAAIAARVTAISLAQKHRAGRLRFLLRSPVVRHGAWRGPGNGPVVAGLVRERACPELPVGDALLRSAFLWQLTR
jgi:hypothetical protein